MTKHLNAKFQPEILRMKGHFWIFIWVSPRQEAAQEEKSTGFSDEQMTIFPYEMTSKGSQADGSSALCDFPSKYLPHKNLHRNYPDFFQKRSVFLRKTLSLLCLVFKKWCVCVFVCVCFVWYVSEKVKPFFPTTNAAFYTAHRICHFFVSDLMFFSCVFGRFREKKHPGSQ